MRLVFPEVRLTEVRVVWQRDRQNKRKKGGNNALTITDTQRALIRLLIPHTPKPPVKYHCLARTWDHNVLTPVIWMKEPSLHTDQSRTGPKEMPTNDTHRPPPFPTQHTLNPLSTLVNPHKIKSTGTQKL